MAEDAIAGLDPAQKRALLARRLKAADPDRAPLSLAQQRLWFIEQMRPGSPVYVIAKALRLSGALDAGRLEAALNRLRARHASLRTRFGEHDGAPVQVIDPPAPLAMERRDLSAAPDALSEVLEEFAARPFDLARGPLLRCALLKLGPEDHALAFAAHHIIADYRSLEVLTGELAALLDGRALPPVALQYGAYALAQRARADKLAGALAHWRETLDGLAPLLDLPTDFPRPPEQGAGGGRVFFRIDAALTRRVEAASQARGATPFMTMLAIFALLHARHAGEEDICLGATVSNRDSAALQGAVGYFVNTLALRCRVAPADTFDSLLARAKDVTLTAMAHQETPFEQVVDAVAPQRSLAHAPLFQSMINLHRKQPDSHRAGGLTLCPEPLPGRTARFDLALDLFHGAAMSGVLEYRADLFRPETVARMAAQYVRLLDAALADPARPLAEIDLLDAGERATLEAANRTARPIPREDLATLIARKAAEDGAAAALIAGDVTLSRGALDAAANRLAAHLAPRVGKGDRLAICLPRGARMVVAMLAALKLGAPYVPLDPAHPPQRLRDIVEDAAPALLLSDGEPPFAPPCPVLDLAGAELSDAAAPPGRGIGPDDIAYVIFTSGTTGRPKGAPIRQRSLVNLLTSMAERPGMTARDRLVALTTPAFDIAALELFLPLTTGGVLTLADEWDALDGAALSRLLGDSGATMMQATPATWRLLTEAGWRAPEGFAMLCGGEALDPALAARLLEGEGRLWNLYGPTETTIWSACAEITREDCSAGAIPLGAPVANTTLHVLDAAGRLCPPGAAGELHIGGAGLSPGYLDRPDLTEERFVTIGGERLYRTGDRAKRRADGALIYLGRLDFQVKLRGFRIELGEIESRLAADPAVDEAVVALRGAGEDAALIGYVRADPAPEGLAERLRARAAAHLPGYMVPTAIVVLDAFPRTANGKLDRRRLPAAPETRPATSQPPRSGAEALVSRLWAEILEIAPPGREAEFFALGGHSLLAMRMIARLPHAGPHAVPLRLLFERPRLADFAAALEAGGLLREVPPPPIPRLPEGAPIPLSHAQARQWALAALEPDSAAYVIPAALRLEGAVDAARLARAFALLLERHEVLRSVYPAGNGRPRVIVRPADDAAFAQCETTEEALDAAISQVAARPFDLAAGPLARLTLLRLGPDRSALLLTLHHIVGDAQSVGLLLRELMTLYAALAGDPDHRPAPLPLQYGDYAAWRRAQDCADDVGWWVAALDGAPPLLDLPTDFPRPARQSFEGGAVDFTLDAGAARALRRLASAAQATPFMALLTAFSVFLGRYAGTREVVVGAPVSLRDHPDLEALAGLFVNTLALRLPCDPAAGFRKLLLDSRERVLAGLERQDAPFERVVEALAPERSFSHNPVFQAMFVWRAQEPAPRTGPDGLRWSAHVSPGATAKADITLGVLDRGDGFALRLEYRRDLFTPETAREMTLAFGALVGSIAAAPDAPVGGLSLLHPDQARRIDAWNAQDAARADGPADAPQTLPELVAAAARRNGSAIALRDRDHALGYARLEARSDALAAHLQARGIGRGDRVGVALARRVDLVVALLAVLKTGAAYVPLDPGYPPARIALIAEDAQLALTLADAPGEGALDLRDFWDGPPGMADTRGGVAGRPAPTALDGDDPAYLIYTSGSTGRPKGVTIAHRNAAALIRWAHGAFSSGELSGVLASTSVCFDLSVFEIFVTLAAGGTVLIADDLFDLPDAPFAPEVTLINTVPTPMAELLRLGPLPPRLRTICLAGEPLPPALARHIHEAGDVALWNLYGPSEDTTYSTGMILPRGGGFNIGRPVAGARAHVLDAQLNPVPPGLPGELYLSGAGVARGYWGRPDLTAERFLPNPFDADGSGPAMYRTGDRVRRRADGTLDYLGRADRQVKLRGFRVEPGEVESALCLSPGVTGAAVGLWREGDGPARLAAWVEGGGPPEALARALAQSLPSHLIPALFIAVDALPRLPNGKLDRAALPPPAAPEAQAEAAEPPRPGLERDLAAIWARALGRGVQDRHAGFFNIGGDSILAIQVVALAREAGLALAPRDLFEHPTLAALAGAAGKAGGVAAPRGPVAGRQSLTPIQRWLLARDLPAPAHWNQALALAPSRPLAPETLRRAFAVLAETHDALRARFEQTPEGWVQTYAAPGGETPVSLATGDVAGAAARLQAGFDLARGPLWGAVLCGTGDEQRLIVAAHHLLVDGVSWRILLGDLERVYAALEAGDAPPVPPRGAPPGAWADALAAAPALRAQAQYWRAAARPAAAPPLDDPAGRNLEGDADRVETLLTPELTEAVLDALPAACPATAQEALTTALYMALRDWSGQAEQSLQLESHGRPDLIAGLDLSRSVGWLTALYPVRLAAPEGAGAEEALRRVKETLRATPDDGVGYGVLRGAADPPPALTQDGVRFNYLGRGGALFRPDGLFRPAPESVGATRGPANPRDVALEINAAAPQDRLRLVWSFSRRQLRRETVERLAAGFVARLEEIAALALDGGAPGFTPSDFPDMDLAQDELDALLESL